MPPYLRYYDFDDEHLSLRWLNSVENATDDAWSKLHNSVCWIGSLRELLETWFMARCLDPKQMTRKIFRVDQLCPAI